MADRNGKQALEGKLKKEARYLQDTYYNIMSRHLKQHEMIWLVQRLLAKYSLTTKDIIKEILY